MEATKDALKIKLHTAFCNRCERITGQENGTCVVCNQRLTQENKARQLREFSLSAQLMAEGYKSHFNPIDAEVAREYPCKLCGAVCYYIGLKKGSSYRAISRCTGCGNEYEF